MEMNKLKPIKWCDLDSSYEYGFVSSGVTPLCEYDVWQEEGTDSWIVSYYDRQTEEPTKDATGFDSLEAGKEWAWKHYQEKMSFYFY